MTIPAGSTAEAIVLRPATPADAPALAALAQQTFIDAFAHLYRPEDLGVFLASERSEATYAAKLADAQVRVELAEAGGALVAYSLVAWGVEFEERPAPRPARPLFLSQLYCLKEATGLGIGAKLIDNVFDFARTGGADAIQLSVFSENFGAQRFYQRYGFAKVADIDYWVGQQRDDEFLYEVGLK